MDYVEIESKGKTFRFPGKKTLLIAGMLTKIAIREGSIAKHDVILFGCELFDRKDKEWYPVKLSDIKNITLKEGEKIYDKIIEKWDEEKDFTKDQKDSKKKQTPSDKEQ